MLTLMQLIIDAVRWSATYMADGKRAKAILKNRRARVFRIYGASGRDSW